MTLNAVSLFGIKAKWDGSRIVIPGGQKYSSPGEITAEGDWSNAAFLLCAAAACGSDADVSGLNRASAQGDMAVSDIIAAFGVPPTGRKISLADIPDLAPALAVLAAAASGETVMTEASRLRLKESDRISAITGTLTALGADAACTDDSIVIRGGRRLTGGSVDSCGDHRIAMMAACAAVISDTPITISRAESVRKSYPRFFEDIQRLGLKVELR